VCVAGYFWNFVGGPLTNAAAAAVGHPLNLPSLDLGPLATLTLGMLGLGGLHVAERVNGAATLALQFGVEIGQLQRAYGLNPGARAKLGLVFAQAATTTADLRERVQRKEAS
jgi:hypothetical protein